MAAEDPLELLKQALRREMDANHGRKGQVDRRMKHHEGFLKRKTGEKFQLRVTELFKALEALDLDVVDFFASTFDILPRPEELLRRQEKPGPPSRSLANIEAAALALATDPPPDEAAAESQPPEETRSREQLESFVRTGTEHQRNVLREASWSRDAATLSCYLEQLDNLRFDRPPDTAALAETVVVELMPGVICGQEQRLEMLCHAIGAFASAQRVIADLGAAARAIGFGLRLAGRHGLIAAKASLLQRGAYVLRDTGQYDHALVLLDKALVLWAEQGLSAEFGRAMVERASVIWYQGDFLRAETIFKVALTYLSGDAKSHRIHRLTAAQGIAFSQLRMGDSDEAERWLGRAMELLDERDSTTVAKLIWHEGATLYNSGDYADAEKAFAKAREILEVKENAIQGSYVALDLAAALGAQGKSQELRDLAEEMSALLISFEGNRLAEAALMAFIRAALEDRVTERLIEDVGKKLGRAHPLVRARP